VGKFGEMVKIIIFVLFPKRRLVTQSSYNALEVLLKLGLTELQAKTYLTLAALKKAEVKKISARANIARQDVYRIIRSLEEQGLVEKIISSPNLYKAIPLTEGTSMLFQKRTDEHAKLQESLKMLSDSQTEDLNTKFQEDNSEFLIVSERKRFVLNVEKTIAGATSCKIICPERTFSFLIFNFYDCLAAALSRGTKIRVMAQKKDLNTDVLQKIELFLTDPNFELKFLTSPLEPAMVILNNGVNICLSDWKEVPSLWSNNRQVLKLAETIFDTAWNEKNSLPS